MRYLLMMHVPPGDGTYEHLHWEPADWAAHRAYHERFNRELADAGELVGIQALTAPNEGKVVRAGAGGVPITDGIFPEAKEYLAGFWIVDVDSPERAYALAARASAAPGPGGAPLDMPIEVRQVMAGPPDA